MKHWKLTNTHTDNVPVSVITSSTTSKGLLLAPGEFCVCMPHTTATLDAQVRRRLLALDKDFENTREFELGTPISLSELEVDKLTEAEQKALAYIRKA